MANTVHYYFKGICKWAQVHRVDEKYGNYKINLYPDEASLASYRDSGCQNEIKNDEDGEFITFRRKHQQLIKDDLVTFGKPQLLDKAGEVFTDNIGNGSEVVVKISVFPTRNGPGHRLESIMVLTLVEYEGGEESDIEQVKVEGLDDLPNF